MAAPLPWLVVTTVGSREEAQEMAQALVELQLAACVQIEPIHSIYRWRGEIYADDEYRLLCKTLPGLYAQVEAAIRARHSYDLPAIHAIATVAADPVYAAWVAENAGGPALSLPGHRQP